MLVSDLDIRISDFLRANAMRFPTKVLDSPAPHQSTRFTVVIDFAGNDNGSVLSKVPI